MHRPHSSASTVPNLKAGAYARLAAAANTWLREQEVRHVLGNRGAVAELRGIAAPDADSRRALECDAVPAPRNDAFDVAYTRDLDREARDRDRRSDTELP